MPIQTSDLMMRLQPLTPIPSMTGGNNDQLEMEKQRLQLMQQEFENTKQHQQQEIELRKMAESGEAARAQLTNQRLAQQAQATIEAKALEDRQKAYDDLAKYRDVGDYEGMQQAAIKLNQLGGMADRLGQDPSGLPTYQVALDRKKFEDEQQALAQQAAPAPVPEGGEESAVQSLNRMGALGYGLTAGGSLDAEADPRGAAPLSPEEAFAQMQAARKQERQTGAPARGPDTPDFMGGVPADVIDTGAMNAQTQQRLGPVMAAIQQSYPGAYQDSVGKTNEAVTGLALPVGKSLEAVDKLRAGPNAAIGEQLGHENELEKQRRQQEFELEKERNKTKADKELTPVQRQQLIDSGRAAAHQSFEEGGIKAHVEAMQSADLVKSLLNDDKPENDDFAINLLMQLDKNRGAQSEHDAERVTGLSASSTPEQIKSWLYKHINGGTYGPIKDAMTSFAEHLRDQSRETAFSWIDSQQAAAEKADHPLVGKGYRDAINQLPDWLRKEYQATYPQAAEPSGSPAPAPAPVDDGTAPPHTGKLADDHDFMETLAAEAAHRRVDEKKMLRIIGPESGGDPTAKNTKGSGAEGLLQFMPDVAQQYINPHTGQHFTGSHELAQLSAAEQAPIMVKYFADRGVTDKSPIEDYAMAVAAPKYIGGPRSMVIKEYRPGTKFGDDVRRKNPAWIPKGGGDITVGSILDSYGIHAGSNVARTSRRAPGIVHPDLHPESDTAQAASTGADDAKLLEGI